MASTTDSAPPVVRMQLKRVALATFVQADEELRRSSVLRGLDSKFLEALFAGAVAKRYEDGASLFTQGESGQALFFLLKGSARLGCEWQEQMIELPAKKGDVVGEHEAMNGCQKRCWSVTAVGEMDVAEVPRDIIQQLGKVLPAFWLNLQEIEEQRRAQRDEMVAFLNRW